MLDRLRRKVRIYERMIKEQFLIRDLSARQLQLIDRIKSQKITYLSKAKLANIAYAIDRLKKYKLKGIFVEAGCALGGSSILISKLKNTNSKFYVFDVFGMIPPPTEDDTKDVHQRYKTIVEGNSKGLGDDPYYGYQDNLYEKVLENFSSFDVDPQEENVQLIKGKVQDTMEISEPVAFAHVDVDWYDPVKTCLQQIWPKLQPGGVLILDDYHDWGGCRKATDEYFGKLDGGFTMDDRFGSMRVTKLDSELD